ncbi:MAG: efflux RND transporter permease subunit [Candidatus Marinimicrobia bacterium]|nr:efflux RND transporter permease subunit [Candidatus Neomarinimicrobiota bacterium]
MKLPQIAVSRPVSIAMLFTGILIFGMVSLFQLPLDLMPDMELPVITVITVYPGASAEEVEKQVSKKIERVLAGTEDLRNISSVSRENVSFVQLEFDWGTNLDNTTNSARDLLDMMSRELPEGAEKPVIYKISSSMAPVLVYSITADKNYFALNKIMEDDIMPQLRKIKGVASNIDIAVPERQIKINVDPKKLKAYGISMNAVATVLQAENITIPGGNIKTCRSDLSVSVPGEFESLDEIENCAIASFLGKTIRIKDIATLKDEYRDMDVYATSETGRGVILMIQKQSDANTVSVARLVREEVANIQKELPDDVKINEVMATDEIVVEAIRNLAMTILWSLIFVVLVVMIFLRDLKGSLVVFLTIPFSLIVAFIFMALAGWTINIFSLISLIIALGMVVDAAIVVYENITQHVERGEKPPMAAVFGTSEMGMAISASTATTISVFLPMVFMSGIAGIMFNQLAILVAITLLMSLFTSMTLTPMVSSVILRPLNQRRKPGKLFQWSERIFVAIENGYKSLLNWTVCHNWFIIILVAVIFTLSLVMAQFIKTDYLPDFDAGDIIVVFETEIGTSASETNKVAEKIKKILLDEAREKVPGSLFSIVGQTEKGILTTVGFEEGKNIGNVGIHLKLKNLRERSAKEVGDAIREKVALIPEISHFHVTAGSMLATGVLGNIKPIEIEISGNNLDHLNKTAKILEEKLKLEKALQDVTTTIDEGKQEIIFDINRKKASELGLNAMMIAMQVRQAIYGTDAGEYSEEGEEFKIKIRYDEQHRNEIEDLKKIILTNLHGQQILISTIANIKMDTSPLAIDRKSQQRIVQVRADLATGVSLGEAAIIARNVVSQIDVPQGASVKLVGQVGEQGDSFGNLGLIFGLGLALVYMVMAAQFESFLNPLIILFAVPLTIIGIIWAFLLTGTTLSINSFIGAIMLIGIVVNNGIVLVDYTNLLRARGNRLLEAVIESGGSRLRPVLMTSLTTILAMVPMATSKGMGSEMFVPIGVTMIGGLMVSTLITLVFVPSLYVVFNRQKDRTEQISKN